MGILRETIKVVSRRPSVLIIPGIIMFIVSAMNIYIPVLPLVAGLGGMTGGSISEGVVSVLQLIASPELLPILILVFIGMCLLVSLFAGIILPGYFSITDGALQNREKVKGEFISSFKENFLKFFLMTIRSLAFLAVYSIFLLVACIPAIIVTRAAGAEGSGLLLPSVFLDFITVAVMFFSIMFSSTYIIYWYPSTLKKLNRPFTAGKHLADAHFWNISARLLVFGIIFLAYVYITLSTEILLLKFLIGWIPGSLFIAVFVVFVFKTYNGYLAEVMQQD